MGSEAAEMLKHRIADLRAAITINDLVVGSPRVLANTSGLYMSINLRDGQKLIFCANHVENPTCDTGDVDWSRVSRIKILRIEGQYEN